MCASQRIDIFQEIPVENMPDIHQMLADGCIIDGIANIPDGLETEEVTNVGSRVRDSFDALDAQQAIAGFKVSTQSNSE